MLTVSARLRLVLSFALLGSIATSQDLLVLPSGYDTLDGRGSFEQPFASASASRSHFVFDSALFPGTGPRLITQIELRIDENSTLWHLCSYSNVLVRLGTSRNDFRVGSYSFTFDNNWSPAGPQSFFSGNIDVQASWLGPRPNPWAISIVGTPFFYDPSAGQDLIVEMRTLGGLSTPTFPNHSLDAVSPAGTQNEGVSCFLHPSDPNGTRAQTASYAVPIFRFHTAPLQGLQADFAVSRWSGDSPLSVQFLDASTSSAPGGILTWAWDFEDDGIVDSTSRSPVHTYTRCGRYRVRLTVTDGLHAPSTRFIDSRVLVDIRLIPRANFSITPTIGACPLRAFYAGANAPTSLTHEWDFDSDGIVDSTLSGSAWTFTTAGPHTVTYRVASSCGSDVLVRPNLVSCVPNSTCATALPLQLGTNGLFTNRYTLGSSVPFQCSQGGQDVWFSWDAPCDGTARFACCGTPQFDPVLELYGGSCANLGILACVTRNCAPLSGAVATSSVSSGQRYWLRVIGGFSTVADFRLEVGLTPANAGSIQTIAPGCHGVALNATGAPSLGSTVQLALSGVRGTPILWLGTSLWSLPLCATEPCNLDAALEIALPTHPISIPIPCDPALRGARLYAQGADIGSTAGCPLGASLFLATSSTVEIVLG
jgi:PKD repeat protein